MTFQEKLASLVERIEGKMPESYLEVMHGATQDLIDSGIQDKVLKVGDRAPEFVLEDQNGNKVSSREVLAKGPLVLTFYRGVWCPYCNTDLANIKKYVPEMQELGAAFFSVSPELPQMLDNIIKTHRLNFDILHDDRNALADQFGLKFYYPEDLKALYRDQFNIDLEVQQGNEEWALPMPARFVIDQSGIIRYAESEPDYRRRPDPDDLMEVLRKL
ncbi:peroxiredoxin-like family protein [Persicobacter sp. CCB-QB2]|uniref:peroxiredoxin-like family protein n=1 Tax=Persicobacter sp. CCB-QB2 TaxID=1561025 RepID=UPI0006A9A3DE|nr:peroxiredoxin-like family protein [Persicobacter sp. CCB-QB2]